MQQLTHSIPQNPSCPNPPEGTQYSVETSCSESETAKLVKDFQKRLVTSRRWKLVEYMVKIGKFQEFISIYSNQSLSWLEKIAQQRTFALSLGASEAMCDDYFGLKKGSDYSGEGL